MISHMRREVWCVHYQKTIPTGKTLNAGVKVVSRMDQYNCEHKQTRTGKLLSTEDPSRKLEAQAGGKSLLLFFFFRLVLSDAKIGQFTQRSHAAAGL